MNKKWMIVIALVILAFVLIALYSEFYGTKSADLFAMDTYCSIEINGGRKHIASIENIIEDYDEKYDAYDKSSMIFKFNSEGKTEDAETVELIKKLLAYNKETSGAYDFSMKKLSDAWGFSTDKLNVFNEIDFSCFGVDKVRVSENEVVLDGVEVDFGGVMKGYVTDKIKTYLNENQIKDAVINLGGNVYASGKHKIGIQDPIKKDVLCSVDVENSAVVTAGVYQRFLTDENGNKYHHILDPKTGCPANSGLVSVSVIGESATECDVLATAFLVLGIDKSMKISEKFKDNEIIFIANDCVYYTSGLEGKVEFLKEIKHEVIK